MLFRSGAYDIAYLSCLPNMIVMAPSDEAELVHMVATAANIDDAPIAFRYPRGEGVGVDMPECAEILAIGKGRILREGTKIALLSYGTRLQDCLEAAEELTAHGLSTTVADARFAKPLDQDLVKRLAAEHEVLLTIEEGSIGGFGSQVAQFLAMAGVFDDGLKFRPMVMPDLFLDQDSPRRQVELAGLASTDIVATAMAALGVEAASSAAGERA